MGHLSVMTLVSGIRFALLSVLVGALGFLGLSPSSASPSTWSAPQARAAATAQISGSTTDTDRDEVDDISVQAFSGDAAPGDQPAASAITYGGEFVLNVPAGSYLVRFTDLDDRFVTMDYDGGKPVTVKRDGIADLGEVTLLRQGEMVNTGRPTVRGKAFAGNTVKADPGTWTPDATAYSYQWTLNGRPLAGATGRKLEVPAGEAGKRLAVEVVASSGDATAKAGSAQVEVARVPTTITATLVDRVVAPSRRAVLKVRVEAPGKGVGGTKVKIVGAGRDVSGKLGERGRASVTLPRLDRGSYELKAVFLRTHQAEGSRSKAVTLKVRS